MSHYSTRGTSCCIDLNLPVLIQGSSERNQSKLDKISASFKMMHFTSNDHAKVDILSAKAVISVVCMCYYTR